MSLGTKVRQFREAKRLSQDDLALRLDVTQSTISNIESDKSVPNSLLLKKIADELEVDVNNLYDDRITNISNIEKNDGVVNTGSGKVNMQSPELVESILKNQEQMARLMESQNKLIEALLKK